MIVSILPMFTILVSALAVFPILMSGKHPNIREGWSFLAAFIKFSLVIYMATWVLTGHQFFFELWSILPGISIAFKVDSFGILFALVASSLWIVTTVYSIGYMRSLKEHDQTRFFACFALALSATLGVAFSANLLTLYIFYEILSLSTYPLVTHHQDEEAKNGGRKYLSYLLGGSIGLALPAMLICYALTGTLDFTSGGIFMGVELGRLLPILVLMFLFGFGKAGLMPLHSWLPGAMVAPTPVSSLLHAVAVVKVGVFSIARVITGIFGADVLVAGNMVPVICYIAGFTVIMSSLIALNQDNLKRLLAFSTIGQLAYIILALGLASELAWTGAKTHIVMHAFAKITLFFCAGAIYVATGKKYISQITGIGKRMPFTMIAFTIGAMGIIGFPLTGGLISKFYMLLGALTAKQIPIMIIYLVSSFLNVCYFFPIIFKAFFAEDPKFKGPIKEAPLFCVFPPVVTAICTILLFIKPDIFLRLAGMGV